MTVQAEVMAALRNISASAHQEYVQEGVDPPFVVVRRTDVNPLMLLGGFSGQTQSVFVFECWAKKKSDATALAAEVQHAIESSSLLCYRESVSGEDYTPETLQLMEPVQFSIWHEDVTDTAGNLL